MTIGAPQIIFNFGPAKFRLTLRAAMIRKPRPAPLLPPHYDENQFALYTKGQLVFLSYN